MPEHFFEDFYALLEVEPNATLRELEVAYKSAMRRWHPDMHVTSSPAHRAFAEEMAVKMNLAWDVLGNADRRPLYDSIYKDWLTARLAVVQAPTDLAPNARPDKTRDVEDSPPNLGEMQRRTLLASGRFTVLTVTEVDSVLDLPDKTAVGGKRDLAILELLYATGITSAELVSLDSERVRLSGHKPFVEILGTGARARQIPLLNQPRDCLTDYLRHRSRPPHGLKPLFIGSRGQRLKVEQCWQLVEQYARRAGIKRTYPEILRDSFAVHMLRGGLELHKLQELLGDLEQSDTMVYQALTQP